MVHVLAVADTDSYLKWSLATLASLPAGWTSHQVLLRNAVKPSAEQVTAAGRAGVEVVGLARLVALLVRERPDVLLLAATGPVVTTLTRLPVLRTARRPVLVTGLPGISIPASPRAVLLRRACDLFLVHSRRERVEFAAVAAVEAPGLGLGLARLPFLPSGETALPRPVRPAAPRAPGAGGRTGRGSHAVDAGAGDDAGLEEQPAPLVFAAQALVPRERVDREAVLRALAAAGPAVVKLRAAAGEQQTHREAHPYPDLWADLVARGEVEPERVRFATGSMTAALAGARGLVTVSSTAALEAVALGLPILVADDFGVSAEALNLVFAGSGCTGPLAALATDPAAGSGLAHPDPGWLADNYFHDDEDADWLARLQALVARREAGGLPPVPRVAPATPVQVLRQHLRLLLSADDLARSERMLSRLRRVRRALRGRGRTAPAPPRGRPGAPG